METVPNADTTDDGPGLSPDRRQDLLELAEFLGLQEEAEGLRGDLRTERILPRLKRALDLLGLPISTGPNVPGIVVPCCRPRPPAGQPDPSQSNGESAPLSPC